MIQIVLSNKILCYKRCFTQRLTSNKSSWSDSFREQFQQTINLDLMTIFFNFFLHYRNKGFFLKYTFCLFVLRTHYQFGPITLEKICVSHAKYMLTFTFFSKNYFQIFKIFEKKKKSKSLPKHDVAGLNFYHSEDAEVVLHEIINMMR